MVRAPVVRHTLVVGNFQINMIETRRMLLKKMCIKIISSFQTALT